MHSTRYWAEGSIADWSWANTAYFLVSFAAYLGIVTLLVRYATGRRTLPPPPIPWRRRLVHLAVTAPVRALARVGCRLRRIIMRGTDRWWKLFLVMLVGWLWVPTTLLSAFGADIDLERIPTAPGIDLRTAACAGEDYKLLLCAEASGVDSLMEAFEARFGAPLYPLGRITGTRELRWCEHGTPSPLDWQGFHHY